MQSKSERIISDQDVEFKKFAGLSLRRIVFYDRDKDEHVEILTNNFTLAADTIGKLYRCVRWTLSILPHAWSTFFIPC